MYGLVGPVIFYNYDVYDMDTPIALSIGSFVGLIGMFYTWHKDSKDTAKQIQKLETEVEQLKEHKQDIRALKDEISDMKVDVGGLKQTLARVDTNVSHLLGNNRLN